jgi:hypothetical protein
MTSMIRNAPTFAGKVNYKALLTGSSLVLLGLLLAFGYDRQQQKLASEHAILQTIYSLVALPEDSTPNQLYGALSQYTNEHAEARRARIARMAGLEPDWPHILQRLKGLSPSRRSEVYLAMAKEYRMPDTWTPAELERRAILEQNRPQLVPVPQAATRATID